MKKIVPLVALSATILLTTILLPKTMHAMGDRVKYRMVEAVVEGHGDSELLRSLFDDKKLTYEEKKSEIKKIFNPQTIRGKAESIVLNNKFTCTQKKRAVQRIMNLATLWDFMKDCQDSCAETLIKSLDFLGYLKLARSHIKSGKPVKGVTLKRRDGARITPLHVAAAIGSLHYMKYFSKSYDIDGKATVFDPLTKKMVTLTALDFAAKNGDVQAISWILRHNANPDIS